MKSVILLLFLSLLGMEVFLYAVGAWEGHMVILGIFGSLLIFLVALFSRVGKKTS